MSLGWLSIGTAGNISLTGLNVDDGTLFVEEDKNKVGVRNLNPEAPFQVGKARTFGGTYGRTGATVTVTTSSAHGLVTGDIVRLYFLSGAATSGRYPVTVISITEFTFTHEESGTTAGSVDVTLEVYYTEDRTYSIGANTNTITVTMNPAGVTSHNLSVGDEPLFIFYTGAGSVIGDFITGISPPPDTSSSANGNFYINTVNGNVFEKISGSWISTYNLQSDSAGGPYTGANAYFVGSGAPSAGLGSVNDFYVDYDNGNIYRKTVGVWTLIDNGLLAGQTIYSGASEPGNDGDFFMDAGVSGTRGYAYYKSAGAWSFLGTVRDPSGATGVISTDLLIDYGAPSSGLGNPGDLYVDRTGGDVYQKYPSGWYLAGNVLNLRPISGTYRISAVSLDSNVLIINTGWNMINGISGDVYFRAPFSDSEREGANGAVIYSSNEYRPSLTGVADYTGNLFVGTSEAYAQNRGAGISLGGVGYTREQTSFARISGVQSLGSDLRSGDMVLETLYENGPETFMFERMRIKAGGNVGIGTNSPSALLTLDKPSGRNFLLLNGFPYGNGGAGIFFRREFIGSENYNCSIVNHDLGDGSADGISINGFGGVSFCTGSNSRLERVRITSAGNVGVGTTGPLAKSHIWGSTNTGLRISSSDSILGTSFVAFHASTDGLGTSDFHSGSIVSQAAASDSDCRLDFKIGSGQTLVASMEGSGNVGIGTSQPTSRLHVVSTPTLIGNPDFNLVPTGCIMMWALSSAPTGWLFCRGQEVSRTDYARLYAVLIDAYGAGDGTTTFNLPDLRGRVPLGVNTDVVPGISSRPLRATGGSETHTLPEASIGAGDGTTIFNLPAGGGQPHNNLQPFIVLNFIIKH